MIPDSSSAARGPKKSSTAPKLSAQDFETISQAFKELNELGINSFTSLEAYIDWYRNVFGQLALEMLLEDCRKALREKDYKKLLAIMSAMAITHRAHTGSIISIDEPKAIEPIEVEQLLMEYEMYFDELEIEEIVLEEKERSLDEGGYISFSEISKLVASVETHLAGLVVSGEITEDEAKELIAELKDIEVGKFATISSEELEEIIAELPTFDLQEVQDLIEKIEARENVELIRAAKMFGEDGFLDLGSEAFGRLKSDSHMTFAEMEAQTKEFEAELISLVESGRITSDQAYALKDKVENAPIEQAATIREAALEVLNNDALETPSELEKAIVEFVDSDYTEIIAELPPVQEVDSPSMAFDEAGFLSIGMERQLLAPEQVAPDSPAAPVSFSGTDVAATFNPPAQTPVQQMPVQQAPVQQAPMQQIPMQQPAAENFVPVTLFAPGTRPTEAPSVTPNQNIEVTPNLVTQPKSFAKPDVPAQPLVQQVATLKQQAQQQDPRQLKQEQPLPEQKVEPEINEPRPEDHDYDKEPELDENGCINCKKINCDDCGIKMEAEHMEDALSALRSSRVDRDPTKPTVPDSFGSDFQMDLGARSIDSLSFSNSGVGR